MPDVSLFDGERKDDETVPLYLIRHFVRTYHHVRASEKRLD